MQRDKGEAVWVILTVRSEATKEDLVRHLRESGIVPERLTTVRVDGEPATRFWDGWRRNEKNDQPSGRAGKRGRPDQRPGQFLLPVLGIGVLSCVAGCLGILPIFTLGIAVISLISFALLLWWHRDESAADLSSRSGQKRNPAPISWQSSAGPLIGSNEIAGGAAVGVELERSRPVTFLIGLKIERSERSRLEQIAIEFGAGPVLH